MKKSDMTKWDTDLDPKKAKTLQKTPELLQNLMFEM